MSKIRTIARQLARLIDKAFSSARNSNFTSSLEVTWWIQFRSETSRLIWEFLIIWTYLYCVKNQVLVSLHFRLLIPPHNQMHLEAFWLKKCVIYSYTLVFVAYRYIYPFFALVLRLYPIHSTPCRGFQRSSYSLPLPFLIAWMPSFKRWNMHIHLNYEEALPLSWVTKKTCAALIATK